MGGGGGGRGEGGVAIQYEVDQVLEIKYIQRTEILRGNRSVIGDYEKYDTA